MINQNETAEELLILNALKANGIRVGTFSVTQYVHRDVRGCFDVANHVTYLANLLSKILDKNRSPVTMRKDKKSVSLLIDGQEFLTYRRHWLFAHYVYSNKTMRVFNTKTLTTSKSLSEMMSELFGITA